MADDQKAYKVDEMRMKHQNAYAKWSPTEDQQLLILHKSGKSITDIAKELGRNEGAINSRLSKLGFELLEKKVGSRSFIDPRMPKVVDLRCDRCNSDFVYSMQICASSQLWCNACRSLISDIDTSPFNVFVVEEAERKRQLQATGELKTRIQTSQQDDFAIDKDGMNAEIAATLLLCPDRISDLFEAWKRGENNRGRDLAVDWTSLAKPVEIKFTQWFSSSKGFLLVRPPSKSGVLMAESFVDDALYLLVTKVDHVYRLIGWIDRPKFLAKKVIDPVGRTAKQVQCWGVHWSNLERMETFPCARSAFFPPSFIDDQQREESKAGVQNILPNKMCAICSTPISHERLEVFPETMVCRDCQNSREAMERKPVEADLFCPRCAAKGLRSKLVYRKARDPEIRGHFLGCSNFPDCRYTEN